MAHPYRIHSPLIGDSPKVSPQGLVVDEKESSPHSPQVKRFTPFHFPGMSGRDKSVDTL